MTGTELDTAEAGQRLSQQGRCPGCGREGTVEKIQLHVNTARCAAYNNLRRDGTAATDFHQVYLDAQPPEAERQAAEHQALNLPGRCPCGHEGTVKQVQQHVIIGCAVYNKLCRDGSPPGDFHEEWLAAQPPGTEPESDSAEPDAAERTTKVRDTSHIEPEPAEPGTEVATVPAAAAEVLTPLESYADHVAAWRELDSRVAWVKGDIAASVQTKYGERRLHLFAHTVNENYSTVQEHRRVALAYPQKSRRLDISWSVHQVLAAQPDRLRLLRSRDDWTVGLARQVIRNRRERAALESGTGAGGNANAPKPDADSGGNAAPDPDPPTDEAAPTGGDDAPDGQQDGQAGSSGVSPIVDPAHYQNTWDELRRLAPKLHTMTKREAAPPAEFFKPSRYEYKEIWGTNREGERYLKETKRLPVALTGSYLASLIMTVLERGKPELGPDANRADLIAQIQTLTAEVERLSAEAEQRAEASMEKLDEMFPNS
jgi:hypothetical protein